MWVSGATRLSTLDRQRPVGETGRNECGRAGIVPTITGISLRARSGTLPRFPKEDRESKRYTAPSGVTRLRNTDSKVTTLRGRDQITNIRLLQPGALA